MNGPPPPDPVEEAAALRARLRVDLVTAMKAREREVVAPLRSALAAHGRDDEAQRIRAEATLLEGYLSTR